MPHPREEIEAALDRFRAGSWTRLVHAGDGVFPSEEGLYDPADFALAAEQWLTAWAEHHPDQPSLAPCP